MLTRITTARQALKWAANVYLIATLAWWLGHTGPLEGLATILSWVTAFASIYAIFFAARSTWRHHRGRPSVIGLTVLAARDRTHAETPR